MKGTSLAFSLLLPRQDWQGSQLLPFYLPKLHVALNRAWLAISLLPHQGLCLHLAFQDVYNKILRDISLFPFAPVLSLYCYEILLLWPSMILCEKSRGFVGHCVNKYFAVGAEIN